MKIRISEKNLSLSDHLEYLRKPIVINSPKSIIILLNSLFKKLLLNEGIMLEDDVNRPEYAAELSKVRKILKESKEVKESLRYLSEIRDTFDNNKMVGYLTFL